MSGEAHRLTMGRHDTYISAAGTRPPAACGRRGQRGGLSLLCRPASNRPPLPIRAEEEWLDPFLGPRPPINWANDVEPEEGEIPFQPTIVNLKMAALRESNQPLPSPRLRGVRLPFPARL